MGGGFVPKSLSYNYQAVLRASAGGFSAHREVRPAQALFLGRPAGQRSCGLIFRPSCRRGNMRSKSCRIKVAGVGVKGQLFFAGTFPFASLLFVCLSSAPFPREPWPMFEYHSGKKPHGQNRYTINV